MKYRTSATHMGRYASKPFRSSDERYSCVLFDSKEEALRPENVQPFRDFVQVGWATGGGSTSKPKREREFNEEHEVFIQRVPPKLRVRAALLAAQSLETVKAQAAKACARMARVAGLLAGKRKNMRFRHGAVKQPARKEQRKDEQAIKNADRQLQRSLYRQEQIAILSHAVQHGTCSDMLVPLDDDLNVGSDMSRAQATRAQIQCMVVLEFFRLLEDRAQENGGELPGGSVYELAAQAGKHAAVSSGRGCTDAGLGWVVARRAPAAGDRTHRTRGRRTGAHSPGAH